MLSAETKQVLDILRQITGEDGNFKVIEADEILEKLPETMKQMTKVQLSGVIRDLRDREYLKVKYFTPDEYCLLTLRRAEEIQQIVEEVTAVAIGETPEKAAIAQLGKNNVRSAPSVKRGMVFFYSFLGSLLGGGLVAAAAILLQKFLF